MLNNENMRKIHGVFHYFSLALLSIFPSANSMHNHVRLETSLCTDVSVTSKRKPKIEVSLMINIRLHQDTLITFNSLAQIEKIRVFQ